MQLHAWTNGTGTSLLKTSEPVLLTNPQGKGVVRMKLARLVGLCLVAAFMFSAVAVASASAKEVLYELSTGTFPATFTSTGGASTLETVGKEKISCTAVKNKGTIGSATEGSGKTAHLGLVGITFTGCSAVGGLAKCQNVSTKGTIELASVEFHLGLADPGNLPAQLLLVSVTFTCEALGISKEIKVKGSIIGIIKKSNGEPPVIGEEVEKAELVFEQTGGKQKFTEFLLSLTKPENELMTGQHLTTTIEGKSEESGQSTPSDVLEGFKNSAGAATKIKLVEG